MTTEMHVISHELGGKLVLQNGGTTVVTTLPHFVGVSVRAAIKYGTDMRLVDNRSPKAVASSL